jgi:hypothetical protein
MEAGCIYLRTCLDLFIYKTNRWDEKLQCEERDGIKYDTKYENLKIEIQKQYKGATYQDFQDGNVVRPCGKDHRGLLISPRHDINRRLEYDNLLQQVHPTILSQAHQYRSAIFDILEGE